MKIETLKITNFKGFKESDEIKFGRRFNIIIGQNNAGKTSLIDALKFFERPNAPFREKGKSLAHQLNPYSSFLIDISIKKSEWAHGIKSSGNSITFKVGRKDHGEISNNINNNEQLTYKYEYKSGNAPSLIEYSFYDLNDKGQIFYENIAIEDDFSAIIYLRKLQCDDTVIYQGVASWPKI
jgi:AAA15 family ATPase/GTPase